MCQGIDPDADSDEEQSPMIAVVGAEGFIGSHFSQYLQKVEVEHLRVTRSKPLIDVDGALAPDFRTNSAQTIYWLASSSVPAVVEQRPSIIQFEVDYFRKCLTELRRYQPETRIVLLSSASVIYASDTKPCVENITLAPFNQYGHLKVSLENALESSELDYMILRVTNAYGPGQRSGRGQGVIAEWLESAREHRPLLLFGNENSTRDYVHITDVVRAMTLLLSHWSPSEVVNIGSGESISLRNLLVHVESVVGRNLLVESRDSRVVDRAFSAVDISKAISRLSWVPQVGLREGIQSWWELINS